MSVPPATERHPDPGSVRVAIDRHRDIAKYLVGIFAAIGGLLLAGTQLSSLGQLSLSEDGTRLLVAGCALTIGFAMVIAIVALAVSVLEPLEMSLADVIDDEDLREAADARPGLLGEASSVRALELTASRYVDPERREYWQEIIARVVDDAAFRTSQRRFRRALLWMIVCATVAAAAIAVFAYASNPPEEEAQAGPVAKPAPSKVHLAQLSQPSQHSALGF